VLELVQLADTPLFQFDDGLFVLLFNVGDLFGQVSDGGDECGFFFLGGFLQNGSCLVAGGFHFRLLQLGGLGQIGLAVGLGLNQHFLGQLPGIIQRLAQRAVGVGNLPLGQGPEHHPANDANDRGQTCPNPYLGP
jgi:hypothetical protein